MPNPTPAIVSRYRYARRAYRKPHLFYATNGFYEGLWRCVGFGSQGCGTTPKAAFNVWLHRSK